MDFARVLKEVVGEMDAAGVRYALIGGFAMALRGIQRATVDLDFILALDDLEKAHEILVKRGYQRVFHSRNVSHYESVDEQWGRIDILHAFRAPSLGMLRRADALETGPGLCIRVAQIEDLIGLKVQAIRNDPERAQNDWSDIRALVRAAKETGRELDWDLIGDYLRLFRMEDRLKTLRADHGAT